MIKLTVGKGVDNYIKQLEQLNYYAEAPMKEAVYVGGGIITDAIRAAIEALPSRTGNYFQPPVYGVTDAQKAGLLEGLGISRMRNDSGYVNVHVGFDGYNARRTPSWPNGVPNALVARSLESGTTWLKKHPFIAPTVRKYRTEAEMAMALKFDEAIKKRLGG